MQIIFDPRADKEFLKFNEDEQTKAKKYIKLFKESGLNLNQNYLKKVNKELWELRPGKIRLFLLRVGKIFIVLHVMRKKSQKIGKATWGILDKRRKEYSYEKK